MARQKTKNEDLEVSTQQDVHEGRIVLSKTVKILSHLYKLTVAKFIKNEGWHNTPDDDPNSERHFTEWEHTHPYRTSDSEGKSLEQSSAIGGHFHVVKTKPDPRGSEYPPVIVECSPPMTYKMKRIKGRMQKVVSPLNTYDFHTHAVQYVKSQEVDARVTNVQAQGVIAVEANKGAPVPGVLG